MSVGVTVKISSNDPPIISGPRTENNGPPPLTLGPEVELCSPLTETFSIKLLKILNIFIANDT